MSPQGVNATARAQFSAGRGVSGSPATVRARDGRTASWMALGWLALRDGPAHIVAADPWDREQAAWAARAAGATVELDAAAIDIVAPAHSPTPADPAPLREWGSLGGRPIRVERLAATLIQTLPAGAVLIVEGDPSVVAVAAAANRGDLLILDRIAGPARGYSVASAVGVKAAAPDRPVAVLLDDAAFALAAMDVQSAADAATPVAIIVANSGRNANGRPFAYENLAAVVGGHGEAVEDPARLGIHLRNAIAATIPTVINVVTTPVA